MNHDNLLAQIDLLAQPSAGSSNYMKPSFHKALRAVVELHKQILEKPLPPEPKWEGYFDYDWALAGGIELTYAKALHTLAEQTIQAIEKELV